MFRRLLASLGLVAAMVTPALAQDSSRLEEKIAFDASFRPPEERGALPSNDTCAAAKEIHTGLLPFSELVNTAAATSDAPSGACNASGTLVMQNSVWYRFYAWYDCIVTVKAVDQQNYDVIVAVLKGSCNALTHVACVDEPEPATVTFQAKRFNEYYVKVGDWGSGAGGGPTQVSITTSLPNETCATATPITTRLFQAVTSVGYANPSPGLTSCAYPGSTQTWNDVWYTYVAPFACKVKARIQTSPFYCIFAIYKDSTTCFDPDGDDCGHSIYPMYADFRLDAGERVSYRIGTYSNGPASGDFNFITEVYAINDLCEDASELPCNSEVDVNLDYASDGPNEPMYTCGPSGPIGGTNSLWYRFTPSTPNVRLTTLGNGTVSDTLMAVYTGACSNLTQIACNNDIGGSFNSLLSSVSLTGLSTAGTYWVRVSALNQSQVGKYRLMLECPPGCASCPPGFVPETESCGTSTNAGCDTNPPSYQNVSFGTTICGRVNLVPGILSSVPDVDTYRAIAPANGTIKWTVRAQANIRAQLMGAGCPGAVLAAAEGAACTDVVVQKQVTAGQEVILLVRPVIGPNALPFNCDSVSRYNAASTFTAASPADFNGDGQSGPADLVALLAAFGTSGPAISSDLNADGTVNTLDLIQFLSTFGAAVQ
ncbi:MAG: hypothetical protein ACKVZJ_04050 [Phycisphaerales bacterium]